MVVCTLPRSGSWLLCDGLRDTGVAGRPQEYFRPDWLRRFREVGALDFQDRLHQRDPWPEPARPGLPAARRSLERFLAQVTDAGTTDNGVFAIKCHWFQAQNMLARLRATGRFGADPLLHDLLPAVRYVRLTREDKLRQAISWYRAITSNLWWADGGARQPAPPYDGAHIERLRVRLEALERRWDRYFERCGRTPVEVRYESLADDYETTMRDLLRRLGLWSPGVVVRRPRLRRQADAVTDRWAVRLSADRHPARVAHRRGKGTVMRTSIIIVDDFYANPEAVREYALKQEFYHPYQADAEVASGRRRPTWMTSRFRSAPDCPFKSSAEIMRRLEELTGDRIDRQHWARDFPLDAEGKPRADYRRVPRSCLWNCSFHLKPDNGQRLGEGVHNHVVDTWNGVGPNGWTGLLYLNWDAPLRGGLKLWRNIDPAHNYDWMTPKENWQLIDDLGNVPNRLLLCRGSIPHSGARGWGSTVQDGRLYQTFFFRVLPKRPEDPVLASV